MNFFLIIIITLFPIICFSQIINIPEDYPSIQDGINAANNSAGGVVIVDDGIYNEQISIIGTQNIIVKSVNGPESTIIDGRGTNRGRQTNTVQYVSPKMGGIQLVANTTLSGSNDETNGIGVRWSNKSFLAYADWIDGPTDDPTGLNCTAPGCSTESAVKLGGKFSTKAFSLALESVF